MASRWRNTEDHRHGFSSILKEMDVAAGNPSAQMGPAERARSLGLQSNGKGGYIDPGSGQVVAQTVNGELVFYSQNRATGGAVSDSAGGAALVSDQPSWADPVTGMVTTPPGKPEGPEELASVPDPVPAKAPHGYNSFMTQQKKQMYTQDAMQQQQGPPGDMALDGSSMVPPAMSQQPVQDAGVTEGAEHSPEGLVGRTKGQAPPPSFKGLRDRMSAAYDSVVNRTGASVVDQMAQQKRDTKAKDSSIKPKPETVQQAVQQKTSQPNLPTPGEKLDLDRDGDVDADDLEQLKERFIESHELAAKSENMRRKSMDKTWAPLEKIINNMEPGDKRTTFIRNMIKNMKFEDRLNSGAGIGELGRNDVQILNDRREEMLKYNFDDRDSVREFTSQFKDENITDEYAETVFNAMPKKVRDQLTNKGNAAGKGPRSKMHYNGTDADGNAIRGTSGGKSRAIQMMKLLLQTNFTDAYTGLPLNLNSWDLEHVMPGSAAVDDDDFMFRESPDNWVPTAFNVNKSKGDMPMKQFFEERVDNMVGRLDDDKYWNQRQSVYDFLNSGKSALEQRVNDFLDEDPDEEDGIRYPSEGSTLDGLLELRSSETAKNKAMKAEIRDMIKRGDLPKEVRELANKIKDNPAIGKSLMKMMGGTYMINKGANTPNAKSRANSILDKRYQGVLGHMFGAPRETQRALYQAYMKALGTVKETGTEDGFGPAMMESGLMDPEIIKKMGLQNIFRAINEDVEGTDMNMEDEMDDGIDVKEFIMQILPLLAKARKGKSFDQFKNK